VTAQATPQGIASVSCVPRTSSIGYRLAWKIYGKLCWAAINGIDFDPRKDLLLTKQAVE